MDVSPLTQQPRPEAFQQKVVQLYQELFKNEDEDEEQTEGFWREFFLLKPDRPSLRRILDSYTPDDLLQHETLTQDVFSKSIETLGHRTKGGLEELHALETLTIFVSSILSKKYTNPSSDIITVLAGLDNVDTVLSELVAALDNLLRNGQTADVRQAAVQLGLALTSGAYQTSLLTYLVQRDLFPSLTKLIQDSETNNVLAPVSLIGLLANYNKFEFQNPYQTRLHDVVNEAVIQKVVRSIGETCVALRAQYVDVQDDLPEGWTLTGAMHMMGLSAITPGPVPEKKPVFDDDTMRRMFTDLPGEASAILLPTYDFTHTNKLFCFNLITLPKNASGEQPFASFLSLTSYMIQHAHLSSRATSYCHLNLMVIRFLLEDPALCKRICSDESKAQIRLCRQRSPYLPLVKSERIMATAVIDLMIDGVNHNLRRRLDVGLHILCLGIVLRLVSYMSRSRTRLVYHWSELFRSLLALIRFLTTYASDLTSLSHINALLDLVVNLLALSLSSGEAFLPTPAAYDDLFYKVVEAGDLLVKFRDTYKLAKRPSNSIDTLISVSTHYQELLATGKGGGGGGGGGGGKSVLTSLQVAEAIKQGYETLSIQAREGLDSWEKYREADERVLLKKVARVAVGDVKQLVAS